VHADHLDTPRLVADAAGNTVWRWDQQEPFGLNVPDENPSSLGAFEFPLRFPGQYADKETNLHYNLMRDYDPSTGRFPTGDPLGLDHHLNLYSYANFSPLLYTDPTGEAGTLSWCFGGPWGCAAGASVAVGSVIWAQSQSNNQQSSNDSPLAGATGTSSTNSTTVCPDPCWEAQNNARRIYNNLARKRIPQYMYASRHGGADPLHLLAILQRQQALKNAVARVQELCPTLPNDFAKWNRLANQDFL